MVIKVSETAFLEHWAFEGVAVLSVGRSKHLVSANGAFISCALYQLKPAQPDEPGR